MTMVAAPDESKQTERMRKPTRRRRRRIPLTLLCLVPTTDVSAWSPSSQTRTSSGHASLQRQLHQSLLSTLERSSAQDASTIGHADQARVRHLHNSPSPSLQGNVEGMQEGYRASAPPQQQQRITHREHYDMDAWRQGWTTLDTEECYALDGSFPSDLVGTFVQNGPGKFEVGNDMVLHPFDADGMIRAITFSNGKAWYRNRFVETTGYKKELLANKIMYRGVFGTRKTPAWSNVMDVNLKNVANTHVLWHNQRLFCLWDAGTPVEIDPLTLTTINPHVTQYGDRFGAHYKEDPLKQTVCSFCLHPGLPNPNAQHRLVVSEYADHGPLLHRQEYQLPGLAMGHDMGITKDYHVLLHPPCHMNLADFLMGRKGPAQCTEFDAKGKTTMWLIPRRGGPEISVPLPMPPVFCTHVANAFQNEQGHVVVDAIVATSMKMCDSGGDQTLPIWETMDFDEYPGFQLVRYIADPITKQFVSSRVLSQGAGSVDFPVIHPDRMGQSYKYAYCNGGASSTKNAPPQGLVKIDVETGIILEKWLPNANEYLSEVVVAPKAEAVAEDDVYLVATLLNGETSSEVVVFDGNDIARGPIQRSRLKQRLPHALHGSFLSGYTPDMTAQVLDSFLPQARA